jgi:hypothetical protein
VTGLFKATAPCAIRVPRLSRATFTVQLTSSVAAALASVPVPFRVVPVSRSVPPLTVKAASIREAAAPSAKVPAVICRAAALVTLRTVTLADEVTVLPAKALPIWASSAAPGSTSPAQFTGSFQLVPVAAGPPSQAITAGDSRSSRRSSQGRKDRRGLAFARARAGAAFHFRLKDGNNMDRSLHGASGLRYKEMGSLPARKPSARAVRGR